jgi:hypothetical protein
LVKAYLFASSWEDSPLMFVVFYVKNSNSNRSGEKDESFKPYGPSKTKKHKAMVVCDVKHFLSQAQGVVPPSHYQEHVCSYAKYEGHPAPVHSTCSALMKCEFD